MQHLKLTKEKNGPASRAISMVMWIRQYDAEHIAQYGRSRATLGATGRRHRVSIRLISPQRKPWSSIFGLKNELWRCEIAFQS